MLFPDGAGTPLLAAACLVGGYLFGQADKTALQAQFSLVQSRRTTSNATSPRETYLSQQAISEHTLATLQVLGSVRLADGKIKPVLSAVAAAAHNGTKAQKLAITLYPGGPHGANQENPGPGMEGVHRIRFADGSVSTVEKYTKLYNYGKADNWYADVPDSEWTRWTKESKSETCLQFSILNETEHAVGDFKTCHRPGALPTTPYNLTMCFVTMLTPDEKGHGLHAGYRHLLPSIAYHQRHGVDQFVVYVSTENRAAVLDLLAGPIAEGLVTLLLMDKSLHKLGPYDVEYNGQETHTQDWFENDCVNRFKDHTVFLRTIDYDELMYATPWRNGSDSDSANIEGRSLFDELADFRSDDSADYVYTKGFDWELLEDRSLFHATMRTEKMPGRFFKSILKPDRVALTWTHEPTNCYNRVCQKHDKGNLEYSHYRLARDPHTSALEAKQVDTPQFVHDSMFELEAVIVDNIVCQWRPTDCNQAADTKKWVP